MSVASIAISGFNQEITNQMNNAFTESFSEESRKIFIESFKSYCNEDQDDVNTIDLDDVWQFMGFTSKGNAKTSIIKNLIENVDYKIHTDDEGDTSSKTAFAAAKAVFDDDSHRQNGGQNKQKLTMSISAFKKMCMASNTKKGKETRQYYIEFEAIIMKYIQKNSQYLLESTKKKLLLSEKALVSQFSKNTPCIYIANIGVHDNEVIIKFGESNDLKQRVRSHKGKFEVFELVHAFKVANSRKIENAIRQLPEIQNRKRTIIIDGKNTEELINLDEYFTIADLIKLIQKLVDEEAVPAREIPLELAMEQERTKQIVERTKQIQEEQKTEQMRVQLEMMKMERQLIQPQVIQEQVKPQVKPQVIQEQVKPQVKPQVDHEQQTQVIHEQIQYTEQEYPVLDKVPTAKVLLLNIVKRFPGNHLHLSKRLNNYHGYSKEFKDSVERYVMEKYNVKAIKNNGKAYYVNVRLSGHTSFYTKEVYKQFCEDYIEMPENRFKKLHHGAFICKVEYEPLLEKFYDYCKELTPMFKPRSKEMFTVLYRREFIEMICVLCKVKPPSYTKDTIKYFNGIIMKTVHL